MKIIKQISKQGIERLLKEGIIRNTHRGYIKANGEHIGYYKTCGGKNIEDYCRLSYEVGICLWKE